MNYTKVNEVVRFLNLFICSYFLTYYYSMFIGISSKESRELGLVMLGANILISSKRILHLFRSNT